MKPETPEVFAIQRGRSGWKLSRRDLAAAAAVASAASMPGCGEKDAAKTPPPSPCKGGAAHAKRVKGLAFSRDGKLLASASDDGTVKFWALPEGSLTRTQKEQPGDAPAIATGPDGRVLIRPTTFAISPDGRVQAMVNQQGLVELWSQPAEKRFQTLNLQPQVNTIAFSPDGRTLATGSWDQTIKLWSLPAGKELKTLTGHKGAVRSVAISADGKVLASGGWDQTVKLWSLPDGELIRSIEEKSGNVNAVAISPDGRLVAEAGAGHSIKLWSVPHGAPLKTLEGHTGVVYALAISPDGRMLASGSEDRTVRLWSLPDGKPLPTCLMDVESSPPEVKGVQYTIRSESYTVACGSPVPPGAVCTCNCVPGRGVAACGCVGHTSCSCVGHTCSCVSYSSGGGGGGHYWHPN